MAYIAALLNTSDDEAVAALGDRIFQDPEQRGLVSAQENLSGDVRAKLVVATAAVERPELAANVAALTEVQPVDVVSNDPQATLGAPWVDESYVTAFALSLSPSRPDIRASIRVARAATTGQWEVSASSEAKAHLRVGQAFGAERFEALRILQDRLNGQPTVITYTVVDGKSLVDAGRQWPRSRKGGVDERRLRPLAADRGPGEGTTGPGALQLAVQQLCRPELRRDVGRPARVAGSFQLRFHQHQAVARIVHGGDTR